MRNRKDEPVSKAITILAGAMFLVEGAAAYLTGMSKVAAVILVAIGIAGLTLAFRRPRGEDET